MGFGNYGSMMGWGGGFFATLFVLVVLIDLVLFGIWLWKQIEKK